MKRSTFILACAMTLAVSLMCSRVPGCSTLHALVHEEGEASYQSVTNGFHAPALQEFKP